MQAGVDVRVTPPHDSIEVSRSDLVEAIVAELLDYFPGLGSGDPKLLESEARLIATGAVQRVSRESFVSIKSQ